MMPEAADDLRIIGDFLRAKQQHDSDGRFSSDWYRHYVAMFAEAVDPDRLDA